MFEEREVDVRSVVVTVNPEDGKSFKDAVEILKSLSEVEGLKSYVTKARLVSTGEENDDIIIRKGNILMAVEYVDNVVHYTLLEPS